MHLRPSSPVPPRGGADAARPDGSPPSLRHSWPLHWSDIGLLILAYAVITAAWVGIGELIMGPLDHSVGDLDRRVAEEFASGRTEQLNSLSYWAAMMSDTYTKIIVTVVVLVVMLWRWRSWREPLYVAAALILEACCFLTITLIVARPRPDVVRLDGSPVDSSFPSGHVAAAVCYGAFAVVVFLHTTKWWPRILAVVLTVAVASAVAWARMYRGMHFLSDVIAGAVLGLVSLVVTWWILEHAHRRQLDHELERELG